MTKKNVLCRILNMKNSVTAQNDNHILNYSNTEYPVIVSYHDLSKNRNDTRWHWHEEMEITIVNSGTLTVRTEDGSLTITAGQGVIFHPNVMHSLQSGSDSMCNFYSVEFKPEFLFGHDQPLLTQKYMRPIQNTAHIKYVVLSEENSWDEDVLNVINDLIAANVAKRNGYELSSKAYLCQFWVLLLKRFSKESESHKSVESTNPDIERIKNALLYIEKHYAENITLDEVAASIHVSKSECCRCFKRSLNTTPFEFIMKYRIMEATRIIVEQPDGQSFSDLAMTCGFNNASYFNKIFKKYMSCTPSEYRNAVLKAQASGIAYASFKAYEF